MTNEEMTEYERIQAQVKEHIEARKAEAEKSLREQEELRKTFK